MTDEIDRYRRLARSADKRPVVVTPAREESSRPPTREELISIVSEALRSENATGSDVKGLTATLQSLVPELFTDQAGTKPDPCAVVAYITTWAGASGEQIMAELGGREFLAEKLSDLLHTPVSLG